MKEKRFNKQIIIYILFSFIFIYIIFSFFSSKSYATTYTYTANLNDLPADFDAKYPQYKILINTLVTEHPNWNFKLYETGLDWNTVLNNESSHGRNLVQPGYYTPEWGCSCGVAYDKPWKCASRASIEYMMDPRNFLNSYDVFQFQDLTSSTGDRNAITTMLNGTFMQGKDECVQATIDAAQKYNVSPYFIISKIIQEQSNSGSPTSLGNGCDVNGDGTKEYVGYYNLFNIGAYPSDNRSSIENGLKYAQENNWDSMGKSIMAGAKFIKSSYMEVGQTTPYFQKYNVVNKNELYGHQYMTNIWGAYSEGKGMRSKYIKNGIYESSFTFTIPLYSGMPAMKGELMYVNVNDDSSLSLKAGPYYNSTYLLSINPKTVVLRIQAATERESNYYWDKVITPYGIGYMARNAPNDSKQYLVPLTLIAPTETIIDITKNNNFTEPDSNNVIRTEPNTPVSKLKEKYPDATIVNNKNEQISGDTLIGTGAKLKVNGAEYTIVKMGDVSGDGKISPADYVRIKNKIMETMSMDSVALQAADVNKDGKISPADYVQVKNHIMGASKISI